MKTRPCRTKGRPPPACQPPQPSKNLSPLLSMPRAEPTSLPSPQPTPHLPEFPATSVPAGLGGPLPSLPHIFLCGASTPGGTLPDPIRTLTAWLGPCACAALWHMLWHVPQLWRRPWDWNWKKTVFYLGLLKPTYSCAMASSYESIPVTPGEGRREARHVCGGFLGCWWLPTVLWCWMDLGSNSGSTSCVSLGKLLNFLSLHFFSCKMRITYTLVVCFED